MIDVLRIVAFFALQTILFMNMYKLGHKHGRSDGIREMLIHEGEGFLKGYRQGIEEGKKRAGAEHG